MKIGAILFFFLTFSFVAFSQTEIQQFEKMFNDSVIYQKKQAAFHGTIPTSGLVVTTLSTIISSDEERQIEDFIINYKKTPQVNNIPSNKNEITLISDLVPFSAFAKFPIHMQQYIITKKEQYINHIKFD